MSEKSKKKPRRKETVIAPGGPRPREQVHPVAPGKAVRRTETGTSVVRSDAAAHTTGGPGGMVLTPGGYRPRSQVHFVEPGYVLRAAAARLQKLTPLGARVMEFEPVSPRAADVPLMPGNVQVSRRAVPALAEGWISYASWTNGTGRPITSFVTTWTVPQAPMTQGNQTIFLFNGIQNANWIYQPVLQWGPSAAGGGKYWTVASWYVGPQAFHSPLVKVSEGATLVGVMTLGGQVGGGFWYDCEFLGIADTNLPIQNVQQLTWCCETLEVYGPTVCSDYPRSLRTDFRDINIITGSVLPTLNWTASNPITDCGQRTVVASNANPNGDVRIYFRMIPWNHNDLTNASGAPLTAGRPFGYTWSVDKTQHVVYRGTDNHIHELWYNNAWHRNDLTAASGAPTSASDPVGYTWDVDKTQHVVFRGFDGHIHELWYDNAWHHNDLSNAAGAPVLAVCTPVGYTWDVDNTQHVIYRGDDGHIHELWYNNAWHHNDLTNASGGPPVALASPTGYTWGVDKTQHVVYRGIDDHIHELWYNNAWHHNDLTNASGGSPLALGSPAGYTWDVDQTQHVVYRGADNHVHELWYNGSWHRNDLTDACGGSPPAMGDPIGYTWSLDKTQHVMYRGADGDIYELWYNGQWNCNDLTDVSGRLAVAASDLAGYTWGVDGTQHVVCRGTDGHVHEFWFH